MTGPLDYGGENNQEIYGVINACYPLTQSL